MEAVEGHTIRGELPVDYADSGSDKKKLAFGFVDTLSKIHRVNPSEVGLSDLGRPKGFVERQVARWTRQWHQDKFDEDPAMDLLAEKLAASIPTSSRSTILHGDYRLDNCMLDLVKPGVVRAVLDWEMSTLGDPLADLGMLLLFWREPGEPLIRATPSVSQFAGFPSRAELIERYAQSNPIDAESIAFHEALAHFKFATILQGISARSRAGELGDQNYDSASDEVEFIAKEGLERLTISRANVASQLAT